MKNRLERQRCRSIVLGHFKSDVAQIKDLNSIVDLYNIGLPSKPWRTYEIVAKMLVNIDFYQVFTIDYITNKRGEPLKLYAPKIFIQHIMKIVDKLTNTRILPDYEYCNFADYIRGDESLVYPFSETPDFWWDIDNSFFMFFGEDKEKLILESQRVMKENSKGEIEEGDWDLLSRYYYLTNDDLSEETLEFLKPKRAVLQRKLIKILKRKLEQEESK